MKIETNLNLSKFLFFSSLFLFLVFFYLFFFYPNYFLFEKLTDIFLTLFLFSLVAIAYFGMQRDMRAIQK